MKRAAFKSVAVGVALLLLFLTSLSSTRADWLLQTTAIPILSLFLPLIARDYPPLPATATPTATHTVMPTAIPTPTPTVTSTATPTATPTSSSPPDIGIPCLVVVGQPLPPTQPFPPVFPGCVTGARTITWRYDGSGAFIGFTMTITNEGEVIYTASIDIQRAATGRITSYGGAVSGIISGEDFSSFTENAVNTYNAQGGLTGADVTKVYTASGNVYTMKITRYCPLPTMPLTGYKVMIGDQEITIGICP